MKGCDKMQTPECIVKDLSELARYVLCAPSKREIVQSKNCKETVDSDFLERKQLRDCYKNPSPTKIQLCRDYIYRANQLANGYDICVHSYNAYSVSFSLILYYSVGTLYTIITPTKVYYQFDDSEMD